MGGMEFSTFYESLRMLNRSSILKMMPDIALDLSQVKPLRFVSGIIGIEKTKLNLLSVDSLNPQFAQVTHITCQKYKASKVMFLEVKCILET